MRRSAGTTGVRPARRDLEARKRVTKTPRGLARRTAACVRSPLEPLEPSGSGGSIRCGLLPPRRGPYNRPVTFDVGIIGAGIHGASAAYHLASRGLRVVIFERDVPAGGPTG